MLHRFFFFCFLVGMAVNPLVVDAFRLYPLGSQNVKWSTPSTVYWYNHNQFSQLTSQEVLQTLQTAMQLWEKPNCSNVSFSFLGTTTRKNDALDGKNVIYWDKEIPDPQFSIALALTIHTYDNKGLLTDVDIVLNSNYQWALQPSANQYDLKGVLVHELGHFLGLNHSTEPLSAMYPSAQTGECPCNKLSLDEINGICFLYPHPQGTTTQKKHEECNAEKRCLPPLVCSQLVSGVSIGLCLETCSSQNCSQGKCLQAKGEERVCFCKTSADCLPTEQCTNHLCEENKSLEPREIGEKCDMNAFCKEGLVCVEPGTQGMGQCFVACETGFCEKGRTCHTNFSSRKVCLCKTSTDCHWLEECVAHLCQPDSRSQMERQEGDPCDRIHRCKSGFVCVRDAKEAQQGFCFQECSQTPCKTGICQPNPFQSFSFCHCSESSQCKKGEECKEKRCIPQKETSWLDASVEEPWEANDRLQKETKGCSCREKGEEMVGYFVICALGLFFLKRKKRIKYT